MAVTRSTAAEAHSRHAPSSAAIARASRRVVSGCEVEASATSSPARSAG